MSIKISATQLFLLFIISCYSQNNIQGYVSDMTTKEKLIGCSVYKLHTTEGVTTNNYGFFSISTTTFPVSLVFGYTGYHSDTIVFKSVDETAVVSLRSKPTQLQSIIVSADNSSINSSKIGILKLPMKQIQLVSAIGGETDVLKVFQLMPGVQSGNEGTSSLYVRGGTPDQNLILIDDIPLYYVNHIGGFVSVFETNAINDITLVKGGFPAKYGGRLSSVIDIRMKNGNSEKIKGEVGIGILTTRVFVEGPLLSGKTRFMFSLRRCNFDLGSRLITSLSNNNYTAGYTFYDSYSKITHEFNNKNSLSLSIYNGRDRIFMNQKETKSNYSDFYSSSKFDVKWGNTLISLKWNHLYNRKLFGNLTSTYSI